MLPYVQLTRSKYLQVGCQNSNGFSHCEVLLSRLLKPSVFLIAKAVAEERARGEAAVERERARGEAAIAKAVAEERARGEVAVAKERLRGEAAVKAHGRRPIPDTSHRTSDGNVLVPNSTPDEFEAFFENFRKESPNEAELQGYRNTRLNLMIPNLLVDFIEFGMIRESRTC